MTRRLVQPMLYFSDGVLSIPGYTFEKVRLLLPVILGVL